jgi:hypothetical protein
LPHALQPFNHPRRAIYITIMAAKFDFTTPVGRLVGGSLYNPKTTNRKGEPLLDRKGQPRVEFYFALAIPKGAERHFSEVPGWGQSIAAAAAAQQAHWQANNKFSVKVDDGDSPQPDSRGKPIRDRQGYPGHWVLHFSSGSAPKIYTLLGVPAGKDPIEMPAANGIQPGYFMQVQGNAAPNGSADQPGVYLNHRMVCLVAYGPVIAQAAATAAPPPVPAMPPQLPTPDAAFRMPPPPVATPAPPRREMLIPHTYEAMVAQGWNDEQMIAAGHMRMV